MQVEEVSGNVERRILIGMVTSTRYLARLLPVWDRDPLRSRWSNLVGDWCLKHYKKYNEAPKRQIATYYEEWERRTGEKELASIMQRFLSSLSEEFDTGDLNIDALLDETELFLTEVRLERVFQQGQQLLRAGDVAGATQLAQSGSVPYRLRPPERIDVLRDTVAQREGIEKQAKILIRYKGDIGKFYDRELSENAFVLYYGIPKGMKSYMMLDNAWTAMLQRVPVAYFQVGDMTKDQVMRRFDERALRRPLFARVVKYPKTLNVGQGYASTVEWDSIAFSQNMQIGDLGAYKKYAPNDGKRLLELRCYPTYGASATDIESDLILWEQEGFRPKVVVIDYVENLAPVDRRADPVRQTVDTYARLRSISEKGYCLISASQSNKEGFKASVMTRLNFRGSLMSLAYPTALIGINQTDQEKDAQVARLNYIAKRFGWFRETKCCVIAACLDVAQPIVLSNFN